MKYEVQKKSTINPGEWVTVAYTDIRGWAKMIADSLERIRAGEFRVFEGEGN